MVKVVSVIQVRGSSKMKRLALTLLLMVLVSDIAAYFYIGQIEQRNTELVDQLNGKTTQAAERLSVKAKQWREQLLSLVQDPALIESLQSGESAVNRWVKVQRSANDDIGVLSVVKPGLMQVESSMGYAGLDLVRVAVESKKIQMPEVHKVKRDDWHIALVAPVVQDEQVLAVVQLSLKADVLQKAFEAVVDTEKSVYLRLKQGTMQIASSGDASQQKSVLINTFPIAGTRWRILLNKQLEVAPFNYVEFQGYSVALAVVVYLLALVIAVLTNKERLRLIRGKLQARLVAKDSKEAGHAASQHDLEQLADLELAKVIKDKTAVSGQTANPIFLKDNTIEVVSQTDVPQSVFRAYDIRGIVDETLTEQGVFSIGRAIASVTLAAGQKSLVIARDGRLHSPRLSESLSKGILSTGCGVVDIGQVPTPVLYFATHTLDTQSGVMVTGSHNPANYNGLKVVVAGNTLSGDEIQQLYQRIEQDDSVNGEGDYQQQMMLPEYIGAISSDIRLGRMMKIVVDCGNGVAGEAAPMLLSTLGCEVVPLYCDIDGNFPNHHPDPSKPDNLQDLIDKVQEEKAELGLAFDGDGDRLGVVDSQGNIIWPDRQMMLYAIDVLSRQTGADIIYDVKCSRHLAKLIAKHGGKPVMSKTGHSLMKAKMKETNAELGGEMSGHIFFKERWYGFDDALYTAARLLEILTSEFRATADIFADLPDSASTPEINIAMEEGENFAFMEKLITQANFDDAQLITIDGLRVEFKEGWGLIRASNTTPSLVMRFEAEDEVGLEEIKQLFKEQMLNINAELKLDF